MGAEVVEAAPAMSVHATDEPLVISGTTPSHAQSVRVAAIPYAAHEQVGDSAQFKLLADAVVDIAGRGFTVRLDPMSVPSDYFHPGGLVDLGIHAEGATTAWSAYTSVRIARPAAGRPAAWMDPVKSAPFVSEPSSARPDAARIPVLLGQPVFPDGAATAADAASQLGGGVSVDDFTAVPKFQPGTCGRFLEHTRIFSTTIGTSYPVGESTANMDVSSSQGGSYGVAFSATGDAGSFKADGSAFKQSSWGFTWAPSSHARSYRKGIQYGYYKIACTPAGLVGYQWAPIAETGGTSHNNDVTRPDWTVCVPVDVGHWWRDKTSGHAYSYGAGVKAKSVVGLDLSVSRQYSSSQRLHYYIRGRKKLCGNDDFPSVAGKVMERRR